MLTNEQEGIINAGRFLVVGTQGGGKTAIVTKLAARTDHTMSYEEDFGGTIETEFLRINFDNGKFFSLMLPVGGQNKWAQLRSRYGSTAEGVLIVLDSCTKQFWTVSSLQALDTAGDLPYENYPVAFVVTKRDLNEIIRQNLDEFAETIMNGLQEAKTTPITYYSRGFRITERNVSISGDTIPFAILEQIIINSLESKYFTGLVPGDARKGKMLLPRFSLVNCRMFSRALTQELCTTEGDQQAVLGLLNDMRPSMLELDTSWENLLRKYPRAGAEPVVKMEDISTEMISNTILTKLLANDEDINNFAKELETKTSVTGWRVVGNRHVSIFDDEGLESAASLIKEMMFKVKDSVKSEKFTLFDPIEELF
jgi:hypothetical protein